MHVRLWALFAMLGFSVALWAQHEPTPLDFYPSGLETERRPIPFQHVRESDVVWSTSLWRIIDLRELFNQFFYFPIDNDDRYGKKSLAYILWDAIVADQIPIFEDDELLIPIDAALFVERYTRADTIQLEIGYDDDFNEEYETVIQPNDFDGADVFAYALREVWYIDKRDSRQDSRRIALAPMKAIYKSFGNTGEERFLGNLPLFWVPMVNPIVRTLLSRYDAFVDDNNLAQQPSWDYVFLSQRYSSYITRESNVRNRTISQYITGEDAIIESSRIEERVFDIESDMWEY